MDNLKGKEWRPASSHLSVQKEAGFYTYIFKIDTNI